MNEHSLSKDFMNTVSGVFFNNTSLLSGLWSNEENSGINKAETFKFNLYIFLTSIALILFCGVFSKSHSVIIMNYNLLDSRTVVLITLVIKLVSLYSSVILGALFFLFTDEEKRLWISFSAFVLISFYFIILTIRHYSENYQYFSELEPELFVIYHISQHSEVLIPLEHKSEEDLDAFDSLKSDRCAEKSKFYAIHECEEKREELDKFDEDCPRKMNTGKFSNYVRTKSRRSSVKEVDNAFTDSELFKDKFKQPDSISRRNSKQNLFILAPSRKQSKASNNLYYTNANNSNIVIIDEGGDASKPNSENNIISLSEELAGNNEYLLQKKYRKLYRTFPVEYLKSIMLYSFFNLECLSVFSLTLSSNFEFQEMLLGVFLGTSMLLCIIFLVDKILIVSIRVLTWSIFTCLFFSVVDCVTFCKLLEI